MLIFLLLQFGSFFHFDYYALFFIREKHLLSSIIKTIIVLGINTILYSGLIIQFIMKIEHLQRRKPFMFFMEIIFAPILEEMIYRGVLFNIFRGAHFSNIASSIISSLLFGISHLRHIFDHDYTPEKLKHIYFQLIYTTLFGCYTCYAYSVADSIIAPICLHACCNTLQIPRFSYLSSKAISPLKKKLISTVYIVGIILFIIALCFYR